MIPLSPEQKKTIARHLKAFVDYLSDDQFRKDQEDRLGHVSYFQRELSQRCAQLSEAEIEKLVSMLWASQMWGNKQYLVQKLISDNGIEKLRREAALPGFRELTEGP